MEEVISTNVSVIRWLSIRRVAGSGYDTIVGILSLPKDTIAEEVD